MSLSKSLALLPVCAALLVLSACSQNGSVPSNTSSSVSPQASRTEASDDASPADDTSILQQDTKNVVIGSTVDPTNGDMGPHSLSVVKANISPLKKGQLVVCNFANSSGTPGTGTTIEVLNPTPSSSPTRFAQSSDIEGCSGVTVSPVSDNVFAAGMTSGVMTEFNAKGVEQTPTFGSPLQEPFSDIDVACTGKGCSYSAEYVFTSDAKTGSIVSAGVNDYASGFYVQVATGFAVSYPSGTGWNTLGPSGLQYYVKKNVLYIADGVTNTVVKFTKPNNLLTKNEIVVKPGGTTFDCVHKKYTCGKLVLAGSPLNGPVGMTLLPNGNLIVANSLPASGGGNELVEITPAGKVLDTEVIDSGATPAIFGLGSSGTSDSNTVIYYTDTNDNNVHELEP